MFSHSTGYWFWLPRFDSCLKLSKYFKNRMGAAPVGFAAGSLCLVGRRIYRLVLSGIAQSIPNLGLWRRAAANLCIWECAVLHRRIWSRRQ